MARVLGRIFEFDRQQWGFLEGPAKSTIAGLSLTEANYKCAVELLKKRFEKKATVQRAHINQLLQLPAVFKERDTTGLRKLYDSCEAHNRALKALGVKEETYSAIVVTSLRYGKVARTFSVDYYEG